MLPLLVVAGALGCGGREAAAPHPAAPPPARTVPVRAAPPSSAAPIDPASVERLPPEEVRARVQAGRAIFVCAYDDARCAELHLEGSIPWSALLTRLPALARDQEIILYCA